MPGRNSEGEFGNDVFERLEKRVGVIPTGFFPKGSETIRSIPGFPTSAGIA